MVLKRAPEATYEVINGRVRRLTHVDAGCPIPMRLSWRIMDAIRSGASKIPAIARAVGADPIEVRKQLRRLRTAGVVRLRRGHYDLRE